MNAVIDAELRLMNPAVRASRSLAARLLDPEFVEVGASERRRRAGERDWRMYGHQATPVPAGD
ncbi:hypothetical protein ACF08E_12640 [Streptomyces globisporus]|uniref:hypothetical protein n=1 Tax=Streptomyces globisporus TaxID=1908 RepID=UPI0036FD2525